MSGAAFWACLAVAVVYILAYALCCSAGEADDAAERWTKEVESKGGA